MLATQSGLVRHLRPVTVAIEAVLINHSWFIWFSITTVKTESHPVTATKLNVNQWSQLSVGAVHLLDYYIWRVGRLVIYDWY